MTKLASYQFCLDLVLDIVLDLDLRMYFVFQVASTDDTALSGSESKRMRDEWHFFLSKIPIKKALAWSCSLFSVCYYVKFCHFTLSFHIVGKTLGISLCNA